MLEKAGHEVIGLSLVVFTPIAFNHLPQSDWIFFSSKNGVRYFFQNAPKVSPTTSLACLGKGTADGLIEKGFPCKFIGTGVPESTALEFGKIAKGKKVLFPQARQSRESIQHFLKGSIEVINLAVYDNTIRTTFELPYCDLLVFTSPLNVEAFCQQYTFSANQQIISIGETTAKVLKKYTTQAIHVAATPSEQAMATLAKKLIR